MKKATYIDAIACAIDGMKYTNRDFFDQTEKHFFSTMGTRQRKLYEKLLLNEPHFVRYLCEDYVGESWDKLSTKDKMQRYDHFARKMSFAIAESLMEQTDISIDEIGLVVVNQTTGSTLPSIAAHVLSKLGGSKNTLTLNIGYMGCSAALIAIDTAARMLHSDPKLRHAMVLSVEVPSVMMSPYPSDTVIVGNTLFGDGAAGVILSKNKSRNSLYMIEAIKRTTMAAAKESLEAVNFCSGEYYYEVSLSRDLPSVASNALKENLHSMVPSILTSMDKIKCLCKANVDWMDRIDHWAIHPGGKRILELVQKALQLSDNDMRYSFDILKLFGNMSSPSVMFVLNELLRSKPKKTKGPWRLPSAAGLSATAPA